MRELTLEALGYTADEARVSRRIYYLTEADRKVLRQWGMPAPTTSTQHPTPAHAPSGRVPAVRIAYWLGTLGYAPAVAELRHVLGCSRATAYRWHAFAKAAERGEGATP